jgi:hypothetical protein
MASAVGAGQGHDRSTSSVAVEVSTHDPALGVGTWWDEGTMLRAEVWESPEKTVIISGNPAGLEPYSERLSPDSVDFEVGDGA